MKTLIYDTIIKYTFFAEKMKGMYITCLHRLSYANFESNKQSTVVSGTLRLAPVH
jgi:hypothetical protein